MEIIEQSVDVDVPLRAAYEKWTRFEEFPGFMEGVEEVRRINEDCLHWVATIGGKRHEWDAEITALEPDHRIAWRAVSGRRNEGEVLFAPVSALTTTITARIAWEPEGAMEKMADAAGIAAARVKADLRRFKQVVEDRSGASDSWRGEDRPNALPGSIPDEPRSKRLRGESPVAPNAATTTPGSAPGKM